MYVYVHIYIYIYTHTLETAISIAPSCVTVTLHSTHAHSAHVCSVPYRDAPDRKY